MAAVLAIGCSRSTPRVVTTIDGDVLALAADATSIYAAVMQRENASIVRIPKSSGPNVTVVAHTGVARGIAIADGTLYWCELDAARVGHVKSARASDGGAPTELAQLDTTPVGIAADDRDLYVLSVGTWSSAGTLDTTRGSLVVVPRSGGTPHVLADHLVRPSALELDVASVTWSAEGVRWNLLKTGGTPTQTRLAPLSEGPSVVVLRDHDAIYRATSTDTDSTLTVVSH